MTELRPYLGRFFIALIGGLTSFATTIWAWAAGCWEWLRGWLGGP